MKAPSIDDFSALIGIDWADKKHDICELKVGTNNYCFSVILSSPKAINQWALDVKKRYPDKPIAVACELTKGPLIYALRQHAHLMLFSINPSTVAKYRKAFSHSGAKDDPSDALIQAEILEKHMEKLTPIQCDTVEIRALDQLVVYRRKLVQDRVDLSNRITVILKNYYPQALELFKEKDTTVFCDFIERWPTLKDVKKARKQTILNFFSQHRSQYKEINEKRIKDIKSAVYLTKDDGVIIPNKIMISVLIPQFRLLISAIETLEKEIKSLYKVQKDKPIFDSFPGAGPQLAPRILVAFGTNRERYQNASEMQKYTGIAPVIERSGQKSWTHWRYSCPKFLRQTFVEWAGQSVRFSFWAKAYYEQQKSIGKPHNTIIRSLAFKWIRIAFRCWKTKTPYDESKYLEALKRKGSPLLEFAMKS
jgi:transposase